LCDRSLSESASNKLTASSTEIVAIQPHCVLPSSDQDMKGFPIILASYKKNLQMAAPPESLEKQSFIWSVVWGDGRTASIMSKFWSVHHTDHGAEGLKVIEIVFMSIEFHVYSDILMNNALDLTISHI
jgi:hypothetical protein